MAIKGKKRGKKPPSQAQQEARAALLKGVGERLKGGAREARNLSQEEVADALGVKQSLISKTETGASGLNLYLFFLLCEQIGASADEVLGLN